MKSALQSSVLFYLLVACLPVATGLFRIWVHQDAVQLGYALSAEEQRRSHLRAQSREVEVEVAAARSPGRLTQLATNLGLHQPAPHQLLAASRAAHLARADVVERVRGRP